VATIRRRGKRWYCELRIKGHRQGRSFTTKAAAAAWALQREAEMRGDRLPDSTLGKAIARYRAEVVPAQKGWQFTDRRCVAMLCESICSRPIASITAADIAAIRDRRMKLVKPSTVARELTVWRGVFEKARRDWGLIRVNPMADVKSPSEGPGRERRVSDDEIERMRLALGWAVDEPPATLSQQIGLMMLLALETAMRAGEMLSLTWDQVDERAVRLTRTKNGDSRDVPLSLRAVELIDLLPRTGARLFTLSPSSRDALWRKAMRAAMIEGMTFHDLRHEATTRLARKLDVLDLARMTGHRDLRMLRRYYNPTAAEIASRLDQAARD
jgi:integrase